MNKIFTIEDFRKWGSKGGKTTAKKYGKKMLSKWGKMGSKARKLKLKT